MLALHKTLLTASIALGAALITTSASAGMITEYSDTWKPGFSNIDSGPAQYARTVHTDMDTSYKTGSTRVTRTIQLNSYEPGAVLTENGYEKVIIEFDPSQMETASEGKMDHPMTSRTWKPNYFLDDSDHQYHLVK